MPDFQKLSATYQQALLRQVVPFWLKNSRDDLFGGYFDLLDDVGQVIEGDKSVARHAEQIWAFSWIFNVLDGQTAWLAHAQHGATFLSQYAHTNTLACYDRLDRRGRPLAPSTTLFPDCIVAMAYAQLHLASGNDEWAMLAKQVFAGGLRSWETLRTEQASSLGTFRSIRHLSESGILLKTILEMQPLLGEESGLQAIQAVLDELLTEFTDQRSDTLREYILPEGAYLNTPEGRRMNVGLLFQTANFLIDLFSDTRLSKSSPLNVSKRKVLARIVTWCLQTCEQAWDEKTAGLVQYVDTKRQPSIFSDWNQKWAWVHVEAISALLKCYVHTRNPNCLQWFKRIHDFTFQHFPDSKHTGWHQAIDLYGQALFSAKATPTLGCFSLIRCLTEVIRLFPQCEPIVHTEKRQSSISIRSQEA